MKTSKRGRSLIRENREISTLNEQCLQDVFIQYKSQLLGTLFFLLGSVDEAQNALDELIVRCWRSNQVENVRNLRVWVFRVLYIVVRERMRKDWLKRNKKSIEIEPLNDLNDCDDSEVSFIDEIRNLIASLSFQERAVFLLRQNGSLSYRQIGQTTGESLDNVEAIMRSILQKIRERHVECPAVFVGDETRTDSFLENES